MIAGPARPARLAAPRLLATLAGMIMVVTGCQAPPAPPPPDLRPEDYLITVEDLPEGWRASNDPGTDYRTTVCGVDLEPARPTAVTSLRFSMGPFGPFLEQHVRSYADDTAERVINGLAEATPDCPSYVATGTRGTKSAEFTVQRLPADLSEPGVVGWRQFPTDNPKLISDLVFLRRGSTVIAVMSYDIAGRPEIAALEAAVTAIPR